MVQTTPYTLIASYSAEGIFLGMNCVLYAFCVYMLWGQKSISCRLLLLINTVQFLLCAAQIILHTIFLFIVFTVIVDNVLPYLHRVNAYILGSSVIYNTNFVIGSFLSIWRLYVLYDSDTRVCIPAFLFWIAQICASALAIRICATTAVASTNFSSVNMLLWAFITAVNLCVAIPICLRLCIAQKRTRNILSTSPYKSIAIILVECGALITVCSVTMMILYARNYAYALVSLGAATEISIASQFLVTARHAMLSQARDTCGTALETNADQAESSHVDSSMTHEKMKKVSLGSLSQASESQAKKSWQLLDDM